MARFPSGFYTPHTHRPLTHTHTSYTHTSHTHTQLIHTHFFHTHTPSSLTHSRQVSKMFQCNLSLVLPPACPLLPCRAVRVAAPSNDQTTRLRNYLGRLICRRVNSANCCGPKALNECATKRGLQRVKQFAVAKPV